MINRIGDKHMKKNLINYNYLFIYIFTTLTGEIIKTGFIQQKGENLEKAKFNARVQILNDNSDLFCYNLKVDKIKFLGLYIGR